MGIPIKNARIRKGSSGPSPTYVITIPAEYVKNGMLVEGQLVDVDLTPTLDDSQEKVVTATVRAGFRHKADKDRSSDPGNAGVAKSGQTRRPFACEVDTMANGTPVVLTFFQGVVEIEAVEEETLILH